MFKDLIKNLTSSFIRTVGRILAYITIGGLIMFLFTKCTNAATGNNNLYFCDSTHNPSMKCSSQVQFYDITASSLSPIETQNGNNCYVIEGTITSTGWGIGVAFNLDTTIKSGITYSLTVYVGATNSGHYYKPNVKNQNITIGNPYNYKTGNYGNKLLYSYFFPGVLNYNFDDGVNSGFYGNYINYIFTATSYGTQIFVPYNTGVNTLNGYPVFYGYELEVIGDLNTLSTSDIQNVISSSGLATASSIQEVQTSVNNVKNEVQELQVQQEQQHKEQIAQDKQQHEEAEETRKGIWGTIKEVLSGIIELPKKLINLLIDALKSLFIPTQEQLQEIINKSSELTENFGFVGQTIDFFIDLFTSLLGMVNGNGCITLPSFKIGSTSLFNEHTFWEEQNVCLSDNVILNDNIDTVRTITSITLVCLFVTFASKQFHKILSKEESEEDS